jgi:carboxypeptidase PM20D1
VVPIAPGTESQWLHPPFAGDIADGFVWGRGSWDDKGNVLAILEAVEMLVSQGFVPQHTVYLAFGHDEETGATAGDQGAQEIATLLKSRGVHLSSVLDEGLLIMHDQMKGLDAPVALIGIAEKGYATLNLSAEGIPGHSSMPPQTTAIGSLSAALVKLEQQEFPPRLGPVIREMLETLAPNFSGLNRLALSNLWLFEPLVKHQLAQTPGGKAMLHTTAAPTTLRAGNKDSTLPGRAEAHVNFRILPGDNVDEVISHTRNAINDATVDVVPVGVPWGASPTSSTRSLAYARIKQAIQAVFPGTLVAPGLMVGFTDSRRYLAIADDVYRFTPVHAWPDDLPRFHGTNERVSIANYADMIRFYYRLLSATTGTIGK